MKYFVTGAFGFIGQKLCQSLAERGCDVVAFCRDPQKQPPFDSPRITLVQGDVRKASTLSSMEGCNGVFHLASLARVWSRNPQDYYDINVNGTMNVLSVAKELGVQKVVYTSTAGVYGPGIAEQLLDESSDQSPVSKTDYEKSKQISELQVWKFSRETRLPVCIVNPTRVYGPGFLSASNAVTKLVKKFQKGGVQFVPNFGDYIGNYVYIDDVIEGHILAMEIGAAGRSYLLAGANISFSKLFEAIAEATGAESTLVPIPLFLIKAFSYLQIVGARLFGLTPVVTPEFVGKYTTHNGFSSKRISDELGIEPTPLHEGLARTIDWLNEGAI